MLKTQQCRKWLKVIKFPCLDDQSAIESSRGGNVTLHIRARYQYGHVTYKGYEIATHYAIGVRIFTLVLKP